MSPRFRYDPTIPDAGSIGELIARQGQIAGARARDVGNIQAQATLARGQAWGNAIGSIGDVMSRGMTAYQQEKMEAPIRALNLEAAQTRLAGEKANLANEQAAGEERAQITRQDQAFSTFMDEWDGDLRTLQKAAIKTYGPRRGADMFEKLSKGLQTFSASPKDERDLLMLFRDQAQGILALPDPAQRATAYTVARTRNIERGFMTEQDAPTEYDETIVQRLAAFGPREIEQAFTLSQGQQRFGPDGQPIASVPAAERAEPNPTEYSLALEAAGGDPAKALELARRQRMAGQQPQVQRFSPRLVMVDGKEVQANYDALTGKYHDVDTGNVLTGVQAAPTADMRNKTEGRKLVARSITAIEALSQKVITKRGIAQRATAAGRSVESALGNDPEFRTYQDARRALAGNLAVAQQGSRPSDADITAIWLPLVPDIFRDTDESALMKWNLIKTMSNVDGGGGGEFDFDPATGQLIPRVGR